MNIQHLKTIAENRIAYLLAQKENAERIGDADTIAKVEAEIAETQTTLNELNGL